MLTVIAAMKKDLRWMLILAWPCFTMTLWKITAALAVRRTRKIVTAAGTVVIAAGLFGLNMWLRPAQTPLAPVPETHLPTNKASAESSVPVISRQPIATPKGESTKSLGLSKSAETSAKPRSSNTEYGVQHIAPGGTGYQANGPGAKVEINPAPEIIASEQTQVQTENPEMPWVTQFTIHSTGPVTTGDLRLACSGPVIKAGIGRINPFSFQSASNGPDPSDPNTVVYQLGPEPLAAGKTIPVSVYSSLPVKVRSGTIGENHIQFPELPSGNHAYIELAVSIVDPSAPGMLIENKSDNVAEGIIWSLVMCRASDRIFLAYASQAAGYVKARSKNLPLLIEPNKLPHLPIGVNIADGDNLVGSLSVDCPLCKGVTLIVSFVWGSSGWYYEFPEGNGKTFLPRNPRPDGIPQYIEMLNAIAKLGERKPIS